MSVIITKEDLIAYAEVDYIIKHVNEKYRSKIPSNLLEFFETIKDPDYEVYVNPYKPLQEQGLTQYALEIIALLHIKYWCENQDRKEELLNKMRENQEKFEAQLEAQFSKNNIFGSHIEQTKPEEDVITTVYSQYMKNNPDIQDFTDVKEEPTKELLENAVPQKVSFVGKIKLWINRIFNKNAD